MFYYFFSCDKRFSKKCEKLKKKIIFSSNFKSLNTSETLFISEDEQKNEIFIFKDYFLNI